MAKIIKEIDWNGNHYTFTNTFKHTGTKSHDILTMEDNMGSVWTGETTWINRPWHRFDLEEAFTEIVEKAFGPKAVELVRKINETAYSVEDAIETFFSQFKPEDIVNVEKSEEDTSEKARLEALAKYLEVSVKDIEALDNNEFEVEGMTYRVLTDEEADEEFDERVREYWEDYGIEGVGESFKDWIIENALDEDALAEFVSEDIWQLVQDMADEEVVDECVSEGIISEEDAYTDDMDLRDDLDLDDLRQQLVDSRYDSIDDYGEYLRDTGLDMSFFEDYIDDELVIDALKDEIDVNGSGRGQELAYYDGEEHDLDNGLFAYRID